MTHYLMKYAHFSSTKALDEAALEHLDRRANHLNHSDRAVFEMIRCYSVKYGAAHLKHGTLQEKLRISNTTVRNSLRKLAAFKMIERTKYIRPVMNGTGANVYTILPSDGQAGPDTPDTPAQPQNRAICSSPDRKEPSFIQSKPLKELSSTYREEPNYFSEDLFSQMKSLLEISNDSSLARELYGIHLAISGTLLKFSIHEHKKDLYEDLAYHATRITIMTMKTKKLHSVPAYFSGVLRKLHSRQLEEEMEQDYEEHAERYSCPSKTARTLNLSDYHADLIEHVYPGEW